MADFSIGDVAFTGFRIISQRPKAYGIWVAAQVVFGLAIGALTIATIGPSLSQFQSVSHPSPAQSLDLMRHAGPGYLLVFLVNLAVYPIIYSAMNRAVLKPDDDRFGYFRVGADEFRQLGLMLLYLLVMIGVYLGLIIIGLIVGAILGIAGAGAGKAAVGAISTLLVVLIILGGVVFIGVRLSLASPLTFASRRIDLFGSWKLTKGRFWPLFGVALVVFFVTIGLYLIIGLVTAAVAMLTGAGFNLNLLFHPDIRSLGAYFTPARVLSQIVAAAIGAALFPLWLTPPAAVYAQLVGTGAPDSTQIQDVFG